MATNPRPDTRHWQLPDGAIAYQCAAERCQQIAMVVVHRIDGDETPLCPDDWRPVLGHADGNVESVRALERPRCFRDDCLQGAVTVMEDLSRIPLPVCERHWDDLSWVTPDDPDSQALLDASGEPRWRP